MKGDKTKVHKVGYCYVECFEAEFTKQTLKMIHDFHLNDCSYSFPLFVSVLSKK